MSTRLYCPWEPGQVHSWARDDECEASACLTACKLACSRETGNERGERFNCPKARQRVELTTSPPRYGPYYGGVGVEWRRATLERLGQVGGRHAQVGRGRLGPWTLQCKCRQGGGQVQPTPVNKSAQPSCPFCCIWIAGSWHKSSCPLEATSVPCLGTHRGQIFMKTIRLRLGVFFRIWWIDSLGGLRRCQSDTGLICLERGTIYVYPHCLLASCKITQLISNYAVISQQATYLTAWAATSNLARSVL